MAGLSTAGRLPAREPIPWFNLALRGVCAIYLVLIVFAVAIFGYTPTLRRQIEALDRGGASSPAYLALAGRSTRLGAVLGLLVITIIILMVVKPQLWA